MGYALPAAIGAQLAAPDRPTLCLSGDAGMAMVMGELGVVAQRQLPILIIVLNDGSIDLIRSQQVRAGKPIYGTTFDSPDFSRIAAAYGIASARITNQDQLVQNFASFANSPSPRLVEVMLDPVSYPTTPRAQT
jgi:thiamine pyrophosphate-dependent acetolactate synthase large subunit-like protein